MTKESMIPKVGKAIRTRECDVKKTALHTNSLVLKFFLISVIGSDKVRLTVKHK